MTACYHGLGVPMQRSLIIIGCLSVALVACSGGTTEASSGVTDGGVDAAVVDRAPYASNGQACARGSLRYDPRSGTVGPVVGSLCYWRCATDADCGGSAPYCGDHADSRGGDFGCNGEIRLCDTAPHDDCENTKAPVPPDTSAPFTPDGGTCPPGRVLVDGRCHATCGGVAECGRDTNTCAAPDPPVTGVYGVCTSR